MKATIEQQETIRTWLTNGCARMNLTMNAICTLQDCWILVAREMILIEDKPRPAEFGSVREWRLTGLNDSHIETVFRHIVGKKLS